VNIQDSRTEAIEAGRDKLARAMMRFDQLAHRATTSLATLTKENAELKARIRELADQIEQERTIAQQNEKLFSSNKSEAAQHKAELLKLTEQLTQKESNVSEQSLRATRLEEELTATLARLSEHENSEKEGQGKSKNNENQIRVLEERLAADAIELQNLSKLLREKERESATWALKLTAEDAKLASTSLDALLKKLDAMELKLTKESLVSAAGAEVALSETK
jgi:chromosome segregation ATPase